MLTDGQTVVVSFLQTRKLDSTRYRWSLQVALAALVPVLSQVHFVSIIIVKAVDIS